MVCEEKIRLIAAYATATDRYAVAVAKLQLATSKEFDEEFGATKVAHMECTCARRTIQEHRAEHGC
jgi:hypothetical protein